MNARSQTEDAPHDNRATVERKSDRELVVTRTVNGPARLVFDAWTKPELELIRSPGQVAKHYALSDFGSQASKVVGVS